MPTLHEDATGPVTFRNRKGRDLRLPSVTATDAKNAFGRMLETALREGGIVITKHDDPKAVLLSWDEFEALASAPANQLTALTGEFDSLRQLDVRFDDQPPAARSVPATVEGPAQFRGQQRLCPTVGGSRTRLRLQDAPSTS